MLTSYNVRELSANNGEGIKTVSELGERIYGERKLDKNFLDDGVDE
jgi:hypothetical protein